MTTRSFARMALISAALLAASASSALRAQDAGFFAGKTVTINIGSSTGGGLDTYGRLVARHLGKHIPGNPTVVPANVPGAGGNIVAARLYNVAPKDGTHLAVTFPSVLVEPLLSEGGRKDFDANKFNYIGNAHAEVLVCVLRNDAPVQSPKDLFATEVLIGATAPGSTTADFPTMTNGVLGTKMKIITGYKGSREVTLAVEKGEVQGICGLGWSTVKVQNPDILTGKSYARVFVQEDMEGHPELNRLGVPLMISLARSDEERQAMQMFYAQNAFARPFILPPGVPDDRIATLRTAFEATMKDPELLAEAEKMRIDVEWSTGEAVQSLVARMYETPPAVIERVKKAIGRNK
jgi:tripartite-type tricarboxylate transporter receptor subunit TctC